MKRTMLSLVLGLAAALLVVLIAFAHHGQPPEPTCPEGQITVEPAVWVPETTSCPVNQTFTASRQVCPAGYPNESHQHPGYCYRGWPPDWPEDYAPKVTETFTVTFDYGKSQDPNHCHRPTGQSLGVPSWAMNEFNAQFPEWVDATVTPGYWIPPICRDPIPGCTDPLAMNYNPAAEVDDGSCQYPYVPCSQTIEGQAADPVYGPWTECVGGSQSREVTTWSAPLLDSQDPQIVCTPSVPTVITEYQSCEVPPTDVCPNLEGVQETLPEGYMFDEQRNCVLIPPEEIPGCMDQGALNYNPEATTDDGSCQYPIPACHPDEFIWVWDLLGQDGIWRHLRDLGYDGSYDAPSVDQQCYYFGCDFLPITVWGHWVNDCDAAFAYWSTLPRYAGGGQCPLPEE